MMRNHHAKTENRQETLWSNQPFDFNGRTVDVARRLVGAFLVRSVTLKRSGKPIQLVGRIVETEAYLPLVDPSCHAYRGPTRRNASAFGRPGFAYIYFIYGSHFCLNVTTERAGIGAAVLIRAAEPIEGLGTMRRRRPGVSDERLASGPGNLCRAFSIDRSDDGVDLSQGALQIRPARALPPEVFASPRIGLSVAREWPLRFFDPSSRSVSANRKGWTTRHSVDHVVDGRARSML